MKDNYFRGFLVGATIGAVAGLLFAPQSGDKTRKEIKKLALSTKDKAQEKYLQARKKVETKLLEIKEAGKKIDFEGYKKLVMQVVDEIKNDSDVTAQTAKEIGAKLNSDWNEIKSSIL